LGGGFQTQPLRSPSNIVIPRCYNRGVALALWLIVVDDGPRQGTRRMQRLAMATALGLGLLLSAGHADAQWRYTDDKGVSRVTQYKIDVPEPLRDGAEWIGPVGVGKPGLSADQIRAAELSDAIRRLAAAEAGLVKSRNMPAPAKPAPDPGGPSKPM